MFRIEGLQVWILVAFVQCTSAMHRELNVARDPIETMLVRGAAGLRDSWHGDTPSSHYQPTIVPSSDFYSKNILKQLTLLNKKFDRMMIRMIGSTIRDEENDDYDNVGKIRLQATQPGCESLIDAEGALPSGIYHFDASTHKDIEWIWNIYAIYCDQSAGRGWTVVQRRGGSNAGIVDFGKSWNDYAKGFGDLDGEFWLGNEWIHRLTTFFGPYQLRVELEDWDGNTTWAQYSKFQIGSEEQNYRLLVGGYTGNATDSLSIRNSTGFSTYDRRNDRPHPDRPCKSSFNGGWWYVGDCLYANLNDYYYRKNEKRGPFSGIVWNGSIDTPRNMRLKNAKMMIRLKNHPALNKTEGESTR